MFRTDVLVVRADVIVTDKDGHFVDDLRAEDFELYEDGVLQHVDQVQLVDVPKQRSVDLSSAAAAGAEAAADPKLDAASDSPESPETIGAMVFVIDASRLGYWARNRFSAAWEQMIDAATPYAGPKAVFLMDFFGDFHQLVPLTVDDEKLLVVGSLLDDPTVVFSWARNPAEDAIPIGFSTVDRATAIEVFRGLEELAAGLSFQRGRKALVWISEGVPLHNDTPFARAIDDLSRAVHMSNSTIYAIDPTLVTERHRSYGASGRAGPYEALQRDPFDRRALRFDNRRQSLRLAARETGGLAYTFTTKVAEALDEIQRDAGRYYLLSYTPDVINKDGAYHELEVKVLRDDVRVRARAGYVDLSPEQRAEMQEAADRFFPWRVTGRRAP